MQSDMNDGEGAFLLQTHANSACAFPLRDQWLPRRIGERRMPCRYAITFTRTRPFSIGKECTRFGLPSLWCDSTHCYRKNSWLGPACIREPKWSSTLAHSNANRRAAFLLAAITAKGEVPLPHGRRLRRRSYSIRN